MAKQKPGYSATRPIRPSFQTREKLPEKGQRVVFVGSIIPARPKAPKRLTA